MRRPILSAVILMSFALPHPALAQVLGNPMAIETVVIADADGNGLYSYAEVKAALPRITAQTFAAADLDKDGALNAEELALGQATRALLG